MGYYINEKSDGTPLKPFGKARDLIADGGEMVREIKFQENLVCVVDNGFYDAAAYIYSENELQEFKQNDGRHKIWLTHPQARKLSGYDSASVE